MREIGTISADHRPLLYIMHTGGKLSDLIVPGSETRRGTKHSADHFEHLEASVGNDPHMTRCDSLRFVNGCEANCLDV